MPPMQSSDSGLDGRCVASSRYTVLGKESIIPSAGDYVQLAHRIPRWPRQTRGTVERELPDGMFRIRTASGELFEAREDELIRLLRKEDIGRR